MSALVGPNAVTQLSAVLEARRGAAVADAVFEAGGLLSLRRKPPREMIPQEVAFAAHQALWRVLERDDAEAFAFEAGVRTADYLLAHRIPRPAQWVLRALPRRQAADVLVSAIARNAWTFSGSGRFRGARVGGVVQLAIEENPLATGPCAWHRGVFSRLFTALVSAEATVRETACVAEGAEACRFEVELETGRAPARIAGAS